MLDRMLMQEILAIGSQQSPWNRQIIAHWRPFEHTRLWECKQACTISNCDR